MIPFTDLVKWSFTALLLATFIALSSSHDLQDGRSPEEQHHPRSLEEHNKTSYSVKRCFGTILDRYQESHSRHKRLAYFRVKFPHGTNLEIKWALGIAVPSQPKYKTKLQIAISIVKPMPDYLVDDTYIPAFDTLFGSYREGEDAQVKQEYIENIVRRRRDLQVEERIELYGNFQNMLESYGLPGRDCLLRTVCEVAEAPLQFGVIGDLFNLLFTPSVAAGSAPSADLHQLDTLLAAEKVGRQPGGAGCDAVFVGCPTSVFDSLPLMKTNVISF